MKIYQINLLKIIFHFIQTIEKYENKLYSHYLNALIFDWESDQIILLFVIY